MRVLLLKNLTDIHGRKYKKEDLLEQLMKKDKPLLGEVGSGELTVQLDKVSHSISNIMFDGDDLYGDVMFLNTPLGYFLKNLMESIPTYVRFGIRAVGVVNDKQEVSDLGLITFDVYSDILK